MESELAAASGNAYDRKLTEYGETSDLFERLGGYDLEHRIEEVLTGLGLASLSRDQEVPTLSGGQKRRLALAALLLRSPDVLLLDEPTNHIHFDILGELEKALEAFAGPIVAVSHDRWFIDRFAGEVWELRDGRLRGVRLDASGTLC